MSIIIVICGRVLCTSHTYVYGSIEQSGVCLFNTYSEEMCNTNFRQQVRIMERLRCYEWRTIHLTCSLRTYTRGVYGTQARTSRKNSGFDSLAPKCDDLVSTPVSVPNCHVEHASMRASRRFRVGISPTLSVPSAAAAAGLVCSHIPSAHNSRALDDTTSARVAYGNARCRILQQTPVN